MVQAHRQGARGFVGKQVGFRCVDGLQQRSCFIGVGQVIAQGVGHCGFGAISDHADGVEEIFALRGERLEAFCLGQVFHLDMPGRRLACCFEGFYFGLMFLDALLQGRFGLHHRFDLLRLQPRFKGGFPELGQQTGTLPDG